MRSCCQPSPSWHSPFFSWPWSKNMQYSPVCYNRNMFLHLHVEMNCPPHLVARPWWHRHLKAQSLSISIPHTSIVLSCNPSWILFVALSLTPLWCPRFSQVPPSMWFGLQMPSPCWCGPKNCYLLALCKWRSCIGLKWRSTSFWSRGCCEVISVPP